MKKVIVKEINAGPSIIDAPIPITAEGKVLVKVLAVGYHHLVKGRATGAHYSALPGVKERPVGIDGVGYINGTKKLVYFIAVGPEEGAYAEYVAVKEDNTFPFPSNATSEIAIGSVAALSNAAMSCIFALEYKAINMKKDSTIAILGATGAAGKMAIQVAKRVYNAKKVIAIARSKSKLIEIQSKNPECDEVISFDSLDEDILNSKVLGSVDIVLDYLWGDPALRFMEIMLKAKEVSYNPLVWIEIGQIAGKARIDVDASWFRSKNFFVTGSGLGPLSTVEMAVCLKKSTELIANGTIGGEINPIPIDNIAREWNAEWDNSSRKYFYFST